MASFFKRFSNTFPRATGGLILLVAIILGAYFGMNFYGEDEQVDAPPFAVELAEHAVPPVQGNATLSDDGMYYIYDAKPELGDLTDRVNSFEYYSPLDKLGRCGAAVACLGQGLMPTEERGNISEVHPTGWHKDKYDFIDGGNLYNRCHLIAFSLAGENANDRNLITGTRQLNNTMNNFEIEIANYVRNTGNHVAYRVTPVFEGNELVARGVQLEAVSIEDKGLTINYNVFIPNVQDGVGIDYATGDNWLIEDPTAAKAA